MRIALLADFPVHTLPGFENRTSGHHATWLPPLACELEHRLSGLDLHWITFTKEVKAPLTLRAWNQTFHLLPRRKLSLEMLTGFRRERHIIASLLHELKPDLVHGWGTEQGYAYAATDFPGCSILSLQGILQTYCKAAAMPWLTRLQACHESRVLRRAQLLTVESPWGAAQLRKFAPHAEILLLEYAANPACFKIQRTSQASVVPVAGPNKLPTLASSWSLPPASSPLALFVGSISLLKGVDTLLAAFSDPRLRGVELVILGDGDPKLTRLPLTANIHLLGHQPPAEVRDWMSKAWCLVHPTRADTSPNCVKEARVIGLPVVTTPCGGQTQYVDHEKSGFIHAPGDVEGLIQGVIQVTQSRETSLQLGKHGQAECRAALTPTATAERLLEIYEMVGLQTR